MKANNTISFTTYVRYTYYYTKFRESDLAESITVGSETVQLIHI